MLHWQLWHFLPATQPHFSLWSLCPMNPAAAGPPVTMFQWYPDDFSVVRHFLLGFILEIIGVPCSYVMQPICQLKKTNIFNIWTWIIYQPEVWSCNTLKGVFAACTVCPVKFIRVFASAWTRWDPELVKSLLKDRNHNESTWGLGERKEDLENK